MERVLITGASGLLGRNVVEAARNSYMLIALCRTHRDPIPGVEMDACNLEDIGEVQRVFKRWQPSIVVHAAAHVDVDFCETHPDETHRLNVRATEVLAQEAKRLGAMMVFISTDSVFDGRKGHYTETDAVHPLNRYAQSKAAAEDLVRNILPDHLIIRTNFYGWGPGHKLSLSEWILRNLVTRQPMKLFTDVLITPLLAGDLSRSIFSLVTTGKKGTYHVGSRDTCSKFDLGKQLSQLFEIPFDQVTPISVDQFPFKAPRPKNTSLDVTKTAKALHRILPSVEEGLRAFKQLLENGYPMRVGAPPAEWHSALTRYR